MKVPAGQLLFEGRWVSGPLSYITCFLACPISPRTNLERKRPTEDWATCYFNQWERLQLPRDSRLAVKSAVSRSPFSSTLVGISKQACIFDGTQAVVVSRTVNVWPLSTNSTKNVTPKHVFDRYGITADLWLTFMLMHCILICQCILYSCNNHTISGLLHTIHNVFNVVLRNAHVPWVGWKPLLMVIP